MKKLIITLLIFSSSIDTFAVSTLVPLSLKTQMQKQEVQDAKAKNITRLAELKQQRAAQKNTTTISKTSTASSTVANKVSVNSTNLAPTLKITSKITVPQSNNISNKVINSSQSAISGVDMDRVRSAWIGWYNGVRIGMGLSSYAYDSRLDTTAYDWNQVFSAGKGQNYHRRSPNDAYYDYSKITSWFAARGVVGKVKGGVTTTENVGYGTYSCSSDDCTDALITSIRTTFNFFMSEKSYNGAHYRSVVQPNFTKIGLSIIVVPNERRYYLVVHYITE